MLIYLRFLFTHTMNTWQHNMGPIHVWPDPFFPHAWKGAGHETRALLGVFFYFMALLYAVLSGVFWTIIFFCLVYRLACYTLSRKKKTKLIRGGTGNTWGCNFYMGTQNGSKNEIWHDKILIHALELKLRPFKVRGRWGNTAIVLHYICVDVWESTSSWET